MTLLETVGWTFMSTGPETELQEIGNRTFMSTGPNPKIREIIWRFTFTDWWQPKQRPGGHECPPSGGLR